VTESSLASSGAAKSKRRSRARFRSWARRLLLWVLTLVVVLPIGLVILFRFIPVPATPLMIATWVSDGSYVQTWVPLDRLSPNLVRAVIASEDQKFCTHYGFDLAEIDKALDANSAGRRLRGASTISQQTAKNLFLGPERSWVRKGAEAYLTVLIEALWPKRRILETYLNVAEWGPDRFGAEVAAQANFHKPAARLTSLEAARLAVILPNPRVYRVDVPGPYVARQSDVVAGRVGEVIRDKLDACIYR
jgi:monofunctional biosynthetic peptidoglycan transglycosylase